MRRPTSRAKSHDVFLRPRAHYCSATYSLWAFNHTRRSRLIDLAEWDAPPPGLVASSGGTTPKGLVTGPGHFVMGCWKSISRLARLYCSAYELLHKVRRNPCPAQRQNRAS